MPILKTIATRRLLRAAATILTLLVSFAASAEPVTLKLAFITSDRSTIYLALVKPFVDAVNRRGGDKLKIEVHFSGALGSASEEQPRLILDGKADIAFVIPALTPDLFPDNTVIEMPGLFRDAREASLVYSRLAAANVLRGYENFVVLGAVATQTETIHSRKPIASLADIKGQTLRVNNATLGAFISKLGATPAVMSVNFAAEAISSGKVDGVLLQSAQLSDFGIGRLVTNHYLLETGSAPLALLMNRKVFDSLSEPAKKIIRESSGEWLCERYAETSEAVSRKSVEEFTADPRRKVVFPSPADRAASARIADAVAEEWAAASPRNRELLSRARAEIAKLRSSK